MLVPGVIDSTTNFIEHPRLVARRLLEFAAIVGKHRWMIHHNTGAIYFLVCHPSIQFNLIFNSSFELFIACKLELLSEG